MPAEWCVPMLDLKRQFLGLQTELDACAREVIRSGWFLLGERTTQFEHSFARWIGGGHASACANGTDAITIALLASGIGPGDEVITVPNTAFATAAGIERTGAVCRFADIDAATWMIDPRSVQELLHERTRAVVAVHLYGHVAPIRELQSLLPKDVHLIEDCAQAHGATLDATKAGLLSDLACFSFYPSKNLGALGDAGLVLAGNEQLAERCRALRCYGQVSRDVHEQVGLNSRMDELQAALLALLLPYLDEWIARRRRNAALYDEAFADTRLRRPTSIAGSEASHHLYPVALAQRDQLAEFLATRGIQTAVHYPTPIPRQPAFASNRDPIPVATALAQEILSLPVGPHVEASDATFVADSVLEFLDRTA